MKKAEGNRLIPALIAAVAIQSCAGILYIWSIFQVPVIEYYGWEPGSVSLIASFMIFGFVIGTFISGQLSAKTHPRTLYVIGASLFAGGMLITSLIRSGEPWMFYLSYSCVSGFGSGFVYNTVMFLLQSWLPHRRGLASGIAASSFGASALIFSPVIQWMLGKWTVPETFCILGFLFFAVFLAVFFFFRSPSEAYLSALCSKGKQNDLQDGVGLGAALRDMRFWCIALTLFFITGAWNVLVPIIKPLGMLRGLSETAALLTVMLTGAFNAAGRLIVGIFSDRVGRAPAIILMAILTGAAALALIVATGGIYSAAILAVAFAYGGPSATFPAMVSDSFGPKHAAAIYGSAMLTLGLSSVVFNKLSAWLSASGAATGDYTATFIMAAVNCILPILFMAWYTKLNKREHAAVFA